MAFKIYVSDSSNQFYIVDTNDNDRIYEGLAKDIKVRRKTDTSDIFWFDNVNGWSRTRSISFGDILDKAGVAYADLNTFVLWYETNTGFNTASGGSGAVVITQQVQGYSFLVDGTTEGDLAYVEESEGTAWLPGTIGGTYYPAGWYIWTGVEWVSDRNAIANALANIDYVNLSPAFKTTLDVGDVPVSYEINLADAIHHVINVTGNIALTLNANFANYKGVKVQTIELTSNSPTNTIDWSGIVGLDTTEFDANPIDFALSTTRNFVSLRILSVTPPLFQVANLPKPL